VELGAVINSPGAKGQRPIHRAAFTGRAECLRRLLQLGADIHDPDNDGQRTLHYAAAEGHMGCLQVCPSPVYARERCQGEGEAARCQPRHSPPD
jgi:ankyrin repeat protein